MSSVAKSKSDTVSLWSQVFGALTSAEMFKPSQGRVVRQATFFTFLVVAIACAWVASDSFVAWAFQDDALMYRWGIFGALGAIGAWISYRSINIPVFSDFLIGVEAEMRKVTWGTKKEVYSGTVVVIIVILLLAGSMFAYDILWTTIFRALRVR